MRAARVFRFILVVTPLIAGCGGGGGGEWRSECCGRAGLSTSVARNRDLFCAGRRRLADVRVRARTACGGRDSRSASDPCVAIDAAQVTVDGQPFDVDRMQDGSQDGSVMFVSGSRTDDRRMPFESSVATSIDIQHVVVGTIESVDAPHARLSALGQQIYVSDTTRIDGDGTIDAFGVGERILVSGFFSSDGEVVATSIKRDPGGEGFLLRGILHITESGDFEIGRLVLVGGKWDYSFDGFPGDEPADGDPVIVLAQTPPSGGVLNPYSMRYIGGEWGHGPEDIRFLAGMISSRSGPTQLEVEGHGGRLRLLPMRQCGGSATRRPRRCRRGSVRDPSAARYRRPRARSESRGLSRPWMRTTMP